MLRSLPDSPRQLWVLTGAAAVVFAAVVAVVTLSLRRDLHQQMLQRDLDVLSAVTRMLADTVISEYRDIGVTPQPGVVAAEVAALSASVEGVLGVSTHDLEGAFEWGVPEHILPIPLAPNDQQVRYHSDFPVRDAFNTNAPEESLPLVEVRTRIKVMGGSYIIRYWLDGATTKAAFAAMDRRLARQATAAWLAGFLLLLGLSYLQQKVILSRQRQLERRTLELENAHRDLDFSAKNTAMGAVAVNLVHDLRNPLGTLRESISMAGEDNLAAARSAVQKMENIVMEIVTILRDQDNVRAAPYEWEDIVAALRTSFPGEDRLKFFGSVEVPLTGQQGGLLILILRHLIGNALRASAASNPVQVRANKTESTLELQVADKGSGIPDAVCENLFRPVEEAARAGSGIGLALARQLCRALGGDLILKKSDATGTVFSLSIPLYEPSEHYAIEQR